MGLARDLSMGPKRKKAPAPGTTGDYGRLRRLLATEDPNPATLKALILAVAARPERMRPAEGRIYNEACRVYRALTGEQIGPETGTY